MFHGAYDVFHSLWDELHVFAARAGTCWIAFHSISMAGTIFFNAHWTCATTALLLRSLRTKAFRLLRGSLRVHAWNRCLVDEAHIHVLTLDWTSIRSIFIQYHIEKVKRCCKILNHLQFCEIGLHFQFILYLSLGETHI